MSVRFLDTAAFSESNYLGGAVFSVSVRRRRRLSQIAGVGSLKVHLYTVEACSGLCYSRVVAVVGSTYLAGPAYMGPRKGP